MPFGRAVASLCVQLNNVREYAAVAVLNVDRPLKAEEILRRTPLQVISLDV
jgi:hypothetical protein